MGNAASAETGGDAEVRRDADARVAAFRLTSRAVLRVVPWPRVPFVDPRPLPPPPTLPLAPSPRLRRTRSVG